MAAVKEQQSTPVAMWLPPRTSSKQAATTGPYKLYRLPSNAAKDNSPSPWTSTSTFGPVSSASDTSSPWTSTSTFGPWRHSSASTPATSIQSSSSSTLSGRWDKDDLTKEEYDKIATILDRDNEDYDSAYDLTSLHCDCEACDEAVRIEAELRAELAAITAAEARALAAEENQGQKIMPTPWLDEEGNELNAVAAWRNSMTDAGTDFGDDRDSMYSSDSDDDLCSIIADPPESVESAHSVVIVTEVPRVVDTAVNTTVKLREPPVCSIIASNEGAASERGTEGPAPTRRTQAARDAQFRFVDLDAKFKEMALTKGEKASASSADPAVDVLPPVRTRTIGRGIALDDREFVGKKGLNASTANIQVRTQKWYKEQVRTRLKAVQDSCPIRRAVKNAQARAAQERELKEMREKELWELRVTNARKEAELAELRKLQQIIEEGEEYESDVDSDDEDNA